MARRSGTVDVTKLRGGASALLDEIALPAVRGQALIHVRDFTKGPPEIDANNHPIRHGAVVGIHNGVIENDDALLARYGITREEPEMTVDSEAIFALVEHHGNSARALRTARRHGGGVARRARFRDALPRTRTIAAALDRAKRLGPLLRVHASRACDRRGGAPDEARRA